MGSAHLQPPLLPLFALLCHPADPHPLFLYYYIHIEVALQHRLAPKICRLHFFTLFSLLCLDVNSAFQ